MNQRLDAYMRERYSHPFIRSPQYQFAPPGHYYSPLPDTRRVEEYAAALYAAGPDLEMGIDLNERGQQALLRTFIPLYRDFDWPEQPVPGRRFYLDNIFFGHADAIALFCMMRHFAPRH